MLVFIIMFLTLFIFAFSFAGAGLTFAAEKNEKVTVVEKVEQVVKRVKKSNDEYI